MRYIQPIGGTLATAEVGKRSRNSENNHPLSTVRHANQINNCNDIDQSGSPTKRMKSSEPSLSSSAVASTDSTAGRNFGEELSTNNEPVYSNHRSFTLPTNNSAKARPEDRNDNSNSGSVHVNGTVESSSSSVATLRARLAEFGQSHHHQSSVKPSDGKDVLTVERRPKVHPSHSKCGPTPLPPMSAHALVKRLSSSSSHVSGATTAIITETTPSTTATTTATETNAKTAGSTSRNMTTIVKKNTFNSSTNTPALARTNNQKSTSSSSLKAATMRARSTPVHIRIPVNTNTNVQATNEGYASVAELSQWLANDPTSVKKTKQLRRGVNIIAKSRKFDKVLENVVLVQESIPRNCVKLQKEKLFQHVEPSTSTDNEEEGDDDDQSVVSCATQPPAATSSSSSSYKKKDWLELGALSSTADKKKWLSNAFTSGSATKFDAPSSSNVVNKARSEIVTSSPIRDNGLGQRAKDKWRVNRTPPPPVKVSSTTTTHNDELCQQNDYDINSNRTLHPSSTMGQSMDSHDSEWTSLGGDAFERTECTASTTAPVEASADDKDRRSVSRPPTALLPSVEEDATPVDFRVARELLVQRSIANGNDVDSAVQRRTAKFETALRRQASHQAVSSGTLQLKPSWEGNKAKGYVKTYRHDIAPKKDIHELP